LSPGKLADLVLLDCDIFKIDPATIDKVKVAMTVVDGKVVWEVK
jgi:predicted amidohydrolase YtcJ